MPVTRNAITRPCPPSSTRPTPNTTTLSPTSTRQAGSQFPAEHDARRCTLRLIQDELTRHHILADREFLRRPLDPLQQDAIDTMLRTDQCFAGDIRDDCDDGGRAGRQTQCVLAVVLQRKVLEPGDLDMAGEADDLLRDLLFESAEHGERDDQRGRTEHHAEDGDPRNEGKEPRIAARPQVP